jgi:hypothetical protein
VGDESRRAFVEDLREIRPHDEADAEKGHDILRRLLPHQLPPSQRGSRGRLIQGPSDPIARLGPENETAGTTYRQGPGQLQIGLKRCSPGPELR